MRIRKVLSKYKHFLSLEKKFKAEGVLKFSKPLSVNNDISLKEFIYLFFHDYNRNYETIYLNGKFQCDNYRRRSLGDIYKICAYYNPNLSLRELYFGLAAAISRGDIKIFYCTYINKQVYMRPYQFSPDYFKENYQKDEYNLDIIKDFKLNQ